MSELLAKNLGLSMNGDRFKMFCYIVTLVRGWQDSFRLTGLHVNLDMQVA